MKKVLIVTYYWPPGSGAGVQRWLKFSKYLPLSGWEPMILTVDPQYATYPATDDSLNRDIPSGLRIIKTKATDYFRLYRKDKSKIPSAGFAVNDEKGLKAKISRFIRGNFFIPDPRKGWNNKAFKAACEIIEKEKTGFIITTSPPHSTQLIGVRLKKRYPDIKWIADLRDPWTDIYYYDQFYPTSIARKIDLAHETEVLRSADRIITVGDSLKKLFVSKVPQAALKTVVIWNGYDEEDFRAISRSEPSVFTISYTGTLSDSYPLKGFLDAVTRLKAIDNEFRLKFTGAVSEAQKNKIISAIGSESASFIPYADHHQAIKNMIDSSALLLIIPDHKSNKSIITGKLFEYLATGLPVICLGPADGDAALIIDEYGNGKTLSYNDTNGIYDYIEYLIAGRPVQIKKPPEEFRRDFLAKRVAKVLEQPGE